MRIEDIRGFEIDFLCVGRDSSRSGDAIACRYVDGKGAQGVVVVDGGTQRSGAELVAHIKNHYGTTYVDHVVNTHPDQDHASGLSVVLQGLDVGQLWMHQPWNHSQDVLDFFHDGRMTDESLARRIGDALKAAKKLEELAQERRIPIVEPFQGAFIGPFEVLHPSKEAYQLLVPRFPTTPQSTLERLAETTRRLAKSAKAGIFSVFETWDRETLTSDAETSATNESSVTMYGLLAGRGVFLTGDAGIEALTASADYAEARGISLPDAHAVQIPHHGSRNNVTPEILDRILGPRVLEGTAAKSSFVCAAKTSDTHPRRVVTNAFKRRGREVFAAKGTSYRHHYNMPARDGWSRGSPLPFYRQVEEP